MRAPAAALVCLTLLAGCASPYPQMRYEPEPTQAIAAAHRELVDLDGELERLTVSAPPDCRRLCDLQARICELSARICTLEERYPESKDVANRCADGKRRCGGASKKVAERCTCEGR